MFTFKKSFSSFSVNDLQKAKQFYQQTLGMNVTENDQMHMLQISGDTDIVIYEKPDHTPATFTVLNLAVDNVEQSVDQLTALGVRFLQYEGQLKTDEKGIFRGPEGPAAIAWFTDPAGNIISVLEGE